MAKLKRKRENKIREGSRVAHAIWFIVLLLLVVICLFPFAYMILMSLIDAKMLRVTLDEIFKSGFTLKNYIKLFKENNYSQYIWNSVLVTAGGVFLACLFGSMGGYAFAKKKFPGRDGLFLTFLALGMIPTTVLLIPRFLVARTLGLMNTRIGLFLPLIAGSGIFLMHQFLKGLPDVLLEAADIDGCGEMRKFTQIVLPLIKPVMTTLAITTFTGLWGDLLWPLVMVTDNEKITLTLAVTTLRKRTEGETKYGEVFAGYVLTMLPTMIVYMFGQKYFIEGISVSGIKL